MASDYNEYIRTVANGYIEDYLKVKPVPLDVIKTDIMEYLSIEGEYELQDDSKTRTVSDIMYVIRRDRRTTIKEINLEEELEEDPFLENQWLIQKNMPIREVAATIPSLIRPASSFCMFLIDNHHPVNQKL